jgi:hypothetical protein
MFSTTTVLEHIILKLTNAADASNSALMRHHMNAIMVLKKETVEGAALMLTDDRLAGICATQYK